MDEFTRIMGTFEGDFEGLKRFGEYLGIYQAHATQLKGVEFAHEWYLMEVPAEEAAKWATGGNTPQGAVPLIAAGVSPELAADADSASGSVEERIARIADAGIDTTGIDLSALD